MYVSGGNSNNVYIAAIDPATHALGAWSSGPTFNGVRSLGSSVAYKGYLYVIGGNNFLGDVQYIAINADGTLSTPTNCTPPSGQTWCTTISFPTPRYGFGSTVANGYLYIVAGCTDGSASCVSGHIHTAYYAHLGSTGGLDINAGCGSAWCRGPDYASEGQEMALVAANGYLQAYGVTFGTSFSAPLLRLAISARGNRQQVQPITQITPAFIGAGCSRALAAVTEIVELFQLQSKWLVSTQPRVLPIIPN